MKRLIKLAVVILVCILVYNRYFGSEEEKASSKKVFNEVKDLGSAVKDFVTNEHDRFKEGKYDQVLNNIGQKLEIIGQSLETSAQKEEIRDLENERQQLLVEKTRIDKIEDSTEQKVQSQKLEDRLKKLLDKTEELVSRYMKE